ncbi:MAG: L-fucose/L-arabinose isomerase family protein [Oscillospiraceae bacterium]|nr:L-fucose/L-arabinose isomerase family protein [Oscillospiraceae bacterium]
MEKLKLGFCPTRRFTFSKEDALRCKKEILQAIGRYDIEIVDIDDINEEGLLYDSIADCEAVIRKMRSGEVDALFVPHCNFGTEDSVARVCRETGVPVLLWGPRDDDPLEDGARLRDTQCGLLATGKVLRRFGVRFTYIPNSTVDSPEFIRGFETFIRAALAVKAFRRTRILQISTRPAGFWTMICNEGELLERFGIECFPITLIDLQNKTLEIEASNSRELEDAVADIHAKVDCGGWAEKNITRVAALKLAVYSYAAQARCNAVAIQCWSALQDSLGIMPCLANAILTDEGLPVTCETDIHGAVTAVMAHAAAMYKTPPFFADITVRQSDNENGELLFHCGNFPPSLMKDGKGKFNGHFLFDGHEPGTHEGEIRGGDISVIRFDGDNGEYSMFMGKAKGTAGKFTRGTYLWIEVNDWPLWEERLVCGPYVHHCVGIHDDVIPALYEACKYLGITPDLVDPDEEEVRAWMRGR